MVLFVIVVFFTLKRNLNYRSRFFTSISQLFSLFNFQGTFLQHIVAGGLKWTRTTDLTLIRRTL